MGRALLLAAILALSACAPPQRQAAPAPVADTSANSPMTVNPEPADRAAPTRPAPHPDDRTMPSGPVNPR